MNHKRLAPKNTFRTEPKPEFEEMEEKPIMKRNSPFDSEESDNESSTVSRYTDIFISDYTPKSFVVMGNTLSHAANLGKLGGEIKELKIGSQWFFAGYKRDSVKKYIETGIVERAVWKGEKKEEKSKINLDEMFQEFKGAFDRDAEYTGASILEVIDLLKEKYS